MIKDCTIKVAAIKVSKSEKLPKKSTLSKMLWMYFMVMCLDLAEIFSLASYLQSPSTTREQMDGRDNISRLF